MSTETASSERYYATLPELLEFAHVADRNRYVAAPNSWHIVITDVEGSTTAVQAGRYRDVNALGVASIVSLRNAMRDMEIPYVFGGDGATVLVPGSRLEVARAALRGTRQMAADAFGLKLRASTVSVGELRSEGFAVAVARFRPSPGVTLAMLSGNGFAEAERRVKDPAVGTGYAVSNDGDANADFDGFECRWQPVPSRRGRIVSLLVVAVGQSESKKAETYREIIGFIESLTKGQEARPVTLKGLRLKGLDDDYSVEARVRTGLQKGTSFDAHFKRARKQTLVGRILIGLRASAGGFDGKGYRRELVDNTDFRKFDETLRMVLDLSSTELDSLRSELEAARSRKAVAYGLHCSDSALVTCFVRAYASDHVHFVDGHDGGYALAALELKRQLRAL